MFGGPDFRSTNWNKFKAVTQAKGARIMGDRSATRFQRHRSTSSKSALPSYLAYDPPYIPSISVLVTLHCVTCKTFKVAEMHLAEGAKRQEIISYQCASCSPKYRKRDTVSIIKQNPNAYYSWVAMKDRCFNKKRHFYIHYGGRGITICPRWIAPGSGFANFIADLGERTKDRSIDRIDVNGPYAPHNCRWATQAEQNANKRKPYNWEGTDAEWEEEKARRLEEIRRFEAMESGIEFEDGHY